MFSYRGTDHVSTCISPRCPQISAHGDMVTSLDVMEDFALLSSGIDGKLCYWDIRALCSGVNGPPVSRTEVRELGIPTGPSHGLFTRTDV